jgi:uncharacterized protein YbcI
MDLQSAVLARGSTVTVFFGGGSRKDVAAELLYLRNEEDGYPDTEPVVCQEPPPALHLASDHELGRQGREVKMSDSAKPDGDGAGSAAATAPEPDVVTDLYAEISRAMVRLYKEQFGRGPIKAKTRFADPDTVLCTLEGSLTPAEKSLVAMGEDARLRDIRMFFQHACEARFREVIERLTGRHVIAFVSGMDTGRDVSAEIFYLEPLSTG